MDQNVRQIAGAMSGTSADGVDVALVEISGRGLEMTAQLAHSHHLPYPGALREGINHVRSGIPVPLSILAGIGREISLCYAQAVREAMAAAGWDAAKLATIAAHGQTLFHDPPETIQWLDPALLAHETNCPVVSDFRRADCAAGGQGAPLVPLADYLLFRDPRRNRVLLNIGGIANLTYLRAGGPATDVIAFDTGPGNCISDYLCRRHDPTGPGWDAAGQRAAHGVPAYPVVQLILGNSYFSRPPPKSTDGPAMVKLFTDAVAQIGHSYPLEYLLRTACLVTADTILQSMRQFLHPFPDEVIVSGGGTENATLMSMLRQPLGDVPVRLIDELGIPSSAKEAVAFALLGAATLDGLPGNIPSATGASRPVILGSITPRP